MHNRDNSSSSKSPVDFSKINNLLASTNVQRPHHHENHNWLQNRQRKKIPFFYVVPVVYPSWEIYYRSLRFIQFNAQYSAISTSKTSQIPHAQYHSTPDQIPVSQPDLTNNQNQSIRKKMSNERFTLEQIKGLKEQFAKSNDINKIEKEELGKKLNLTPTQIAGWFAREKLGPGKIRKPYTLKQLQTLEERFAKSNKIFKKEIEEMAETLSMKPKQIVNWFHSRRRKLERDAQKAEESAKV